MASLSSLPSFPSSVGLVALDYRAADHVGIAFSGHLQPDNMPVFSDQLDGGFGDGDRHLVLDLHLVRSMCPFAVNVLEMALIRADKKGRTIATAGAAPDVEAALEPLSAQGLRICPTVFGALAST